MKTLGMMVKLKLDRKRRCFEEGDSKNIFIDDFNKIKN
jgi:hypothetical protein